MPVGCCYNLWLETEEMDRHLSEFIELFNTKSFFEAHEVLEDLWIESEGEVKDFYKGLIQCAVAFVHLQRSNLRGAKKVYGTSSKYLERYLPDYEGIYTEKLLSEVTEFFETVVTAAENRGEAPDIEAAATPQIEIV
jgi:uncharacterized protein